MGGGAATQRLRTAAPDPPMPASRGDAHTHARTQLSRRHLDAKHNMWHPMQMYADVKDHVVFVVDPPYERRGGSSPPLRRCL